jgi:hypothetical protein
MPEFTLLFLYTKEAKARPFRLFPSSLSLRASTSM